MRISKNDRALLVALMPTGSMPVAEVNRKTLDRCVDMGYVTVIGQRAYITDAGIELMWED